MLFDLYNCNNSEQKNSTTSSSSNSSSEPVSLLRRGSSGFSTIPESSSSSIQSAHSSCVTLCESLPGCVESMSSAGSLHDLAMTASAAAAATGGAGTASEDTTGVAAGSTNACLDTNSDSGSPSLRSVLRAAQEPSLRLEEAFDGRPTTSITTTTTTKSASVSPKRSKNARIHSSRSLHDLDTSLCMPNHEDSGTSTASAGGGSCGYVSDGLLFNSLKDVQRRSSLTKSESKLKRKQQEEQASTLARVARLSARLSGCPIAILSSLPKSDNDDAGDDQEEPVILSQYGLDKVSLLDRNHALQAVREHHQQQQHHEDEDNDDDRMMTDTESSSCSLEHLPLITAQGESVGTLSLVMASSRPPRSPLSEEEREDLQDLAFLATQAIHRMNKSSRQDLEMEVDDANADQVDDLPDCDTKTKRRVSRQVSSDKKTSMEKSQQPSFRRRVDRVLSTSSQGNSNNNSTYVEEDPSKCLIACTAHDLLTPLMGLQLSLSLLQEDSKFVRHLEEQPLQRESFWTAWQSTEVMFRMCQTTIDTLRVNKHNANKNIVPQAPSLNAPTEICHLDLTVLLQSLQRLMDPIPKQVPLIITLTKEVPNEVPIITTKAAHAAAVASSSSSAASSNVATSAAPATVDWHILRCAMTVMSHACSAGRPDSNVQPTHKAIEMRVRLDSNSNKASTSLLVECEHDCPDLDTGEDSLLGSDHTLALQSVAHQMTSVYGGEHGFSRPQSDQRRAVFWFSVPVSTEQLESSTRDVSHQVDRVITLLPTSQLDGSHHDVEMEPPALTGNITPATPRRIRRRRGDKAGTSPVGTGNGLRALRRSSTGSTNTLGCRRRTFDHISSHNISGLQDNSRTMSSAQLLPNMFRNKSHANHDWGESTRQTKQRKSNFSYDKTTSKPMGSANTMSAHAAMAAAFQASLESVSTALPATVVSSVLSGRTDHLSYSLLKEEEQLKKERLDPLSPIGRTSKVGSLGAGLDRCFQDVLGRTSLLRKKSSDMSAAQRVRDRLKSPQPSASTSAIATSMGANLLPLAPPLTTAGRERKALVIDDSLVIRKTVARALTKLGIHTVVQACDGVEGVQRMKEHSFEICFCDFSMPNLGGIDCVHQYRRWETRYAPSSETSLRPKQYIVGMSAHASPDDIAQAIKVGMNDYQPKPLTIKKLGELLESTPAKATRMQLDAWEVDDAPTSAATTVTARTNVTQSSNSSIRSAGSSIRKEGGLFDDFTAATMLDAMGSSARSVGSNQVPPASNKTKTDGLFSMLTN